LDPQQLQQYLQQLLPRYSVKSHSAVVEAGKMVNKAGKRGGRLMAGICTTWRKMLYYIYIYYIIAEYHGFLGKGAKDVQCFENGKMGC